MKAVRAVISRWASDMSQCPAEGDKTQTPQETNFSIKLSPSPALLCVTVRFMIDDRLAPDSLDGLVSTEGNLANEPFDLHNCVCGSRQGV